jgi:DNA primase
VPDTIVRSVYVKECSAILNTDENALYSAINRIRRSKFEQKYQTKLPEAISEKKVIPVPQLITNYDCEHLEREIVRILLNYGNNIITIEHEEGSVEESVAKFIIAEIKNDELELQHPLYKQVFDEYAYALSQSKPIDEKYFINHPDNTISSLTADLLTKKYKLSRNLFEKDNRAHVPTEEMKLNELVPDIVIGFKNKKVMSALNDVQTELRNLKGIEDFEKIEELQQHYLELNLVKKTFARKMGNRIILP